MAGAIILVLGQARRPRRDDEFSLASAGAEADCSHIRPGGLAPAGRVPWAQLLRRVFLVDVLRCAGCGGRRQLVAQVSHDPSDGFQEMLIQALAALGVDVDDV